MDALLETLKTPAKFAVRTLVRGEYRFFVQATDDFTAKTYAEATKMRYADNARLVAQTLSPKAKVYSE